MRTGRPPKLPQPGTPERLKLAKQIENAAGMGLKAEEVAAVLAVAPSTLHRWIHHPDLSEAIKSGRLKADTRVVQSLYLKAVGFVQMRRNADGTETELHIPGDTTAMIFWLKNRKPDEWRDKHDNVLSTPTDGSGGRFILEVVHINKPPTALPPAVPDDGDGNGNGNPK